MYKVFMKFLGLNEGDRTKNAADAILEHLKDVLDGSDLEDLRHRAIKLASQNK
jgi:hypothetical protein